MTSYERNTAVKSGYYFNAAALSIALVERDGGRLPNEKGRWIAIPALAALALSPFLGALFLMTLPPLGYALTVEAAGRFVGLLWLDEIVDAFSREHFGAAGSPARQPRKDQAIGSQ